ncbi:protein SOSEKI 5 [Cryptomeria japonica]|uniref:protein SOSEKI 5 n=1 Tax=Cryptomeria japonica TaxID=3369 RepID=UPI0027DA2507|nr:protein SOSEKI 5 [Cryptomeria japonica]
MAISPRSKMELRMKQSRDASPDRAKPMWVEPKSKVPRKVQVVYYLSRNGLLEHPHFMEVALSSNEGLYLRDVIHRLNALRGKGMPYLFSWSSKRSYKSGYVWHDLSEDDIIHRAQGEYVLKGSELFEGSSDRYQQGSTTNLLNPKHPLEVPHSSRYQDTVSSTSRSLVVHKQRINNGEESTIQRTNSLGDGQGPQIPFQGTQNIGLSSRLNTEKHHNYLRAGTSAAADAYDRRGGATHKSYGGDSSWSPLELGEYKVYKTESVASTVDHGADVATQTEEKRRIRCIKGVSTEEEEEEEDECNSALVESKENRHEEQKPTELSGGEVSPPPSSSGSPGSPNSKIKSNSKPNSFRCHSIEEQNFVITTRPRASNVLMQLISCGSIAVKDHNFVGIPFSRYQGSCDESRSSRLKVVSTTSSVSKKVTVDDEFLRMPENPRLAHLHLEDKEYFSGSIVETKTEKETEGEEPTLKRCASYNADRSSKSNILERPNDEENSGARAKCIPRKIKSFKKQQSRKETQRTPSKESKEPSKLSRVSNATSAMKQTADCNIASGKNSNMTADSGSQRSDSFRNSFREEQNVIMKDHDQRQSSVTILMVESQALSTQETEETSPTIELRQHLQECRISEMAAKAEQKPNSSKGSQNCKHQNTS